MKTISPHLIESSAPLVEALRRMNKLPGNAMTLFAIDGQGRLVASVTDGDIRRAIAAGVAPDAPVSDAMCSTCRMVRTGDADVSLFDSWRKAGIELVPVVDEDTRPVGVINIAAGASALPLRALIMAGGKGERLRPATLTTPKPLLPIEGKPIIEYNIEALEKAGIRQIYVSTAYLAQSIEGYIAKRDNTAEISCIRENEARGTIGAASMLPPSTLHTLVMNSDLLTNLSLEDMYLSHRNSDSDVSIAVIPYKVKVPYAILDFDSAGNVSAIEEKPTYAYYANAGIYIFSPGALALLPAEGRTDATDLIAAAISAGLKVTHFPINGTWIDIGTPEDFRQAGELMRHVNSFRR